MSHLETPRRPRSTGLLSLLVALLATSAPGPALANPPDPAPLSYPQLCAALFHLEPDPARVAKVSHLVIHRDAASFTLEQGELVMARPVGGRVCAAYFAGRGRLEVSPTQAVERDQLALMHDSPELNQEFRSLVLVFTDSTDAELERSLAFRSGSFAHVLTTSTDNFRDLIVEKAGYIAPPLAGALLEGRHDQLFYAMTLNEKQGRLRFEIDPSRTEEVSLSRVGDGGIVPTLLISQFRLNGLASDDLLTDERPAIAIRTYTIDMALGTAMTPYYTTDMGIEVLEDSLRYLHFMLGDFKDGVDSVRTQTGERWQARCSTTKPSSASPFAAAGLSPTTARQQGATC